MLTETFGTSLDSTIKSVYGRQVAIYGVGQLADCIAGGPIDTVR